MRNDFPDFILNKIVSLYETAVKQLPALKYSWGLVAIICILALVNFFNIGRSEVVFRSIIWTLGIIFLIFIFSFLTKTDDKIIRTGLYILSYSILLTLTALVLGFAIHTFTSLKFPFYEVLLKTSDSVKPGDSTISRQQGTLTKEDSIASETVYPIEQHPTSPSGRSNAGNGSKTTGQSTGHILKDSSSENCTSRCDTKGIKDIEVSFIDPRKNKKYSASSEGKDLEFTVPCYLLELTVSVTFKKKNDEPETRNVNLKEFEIPDMFKD
ncbi:MAG: hypothetical protein ABIQ31_06775 [Ferruginibacter sp.]